MIKKLLLLIFSILFISIISFYFNQMKREHLIKNEKVFTLPRKNMEKDADYLLAVKNEFKENDIVVVEVPIDYDKETLLKISEEYGYKIINIQEIKNNYVEIIFQKKENSKRPIKNEKIGKPADNKDFENADIVVISEINENFDTQKMFQVILTNAKANNFTRVFLPKEYNIEELSSFMLDNGFELNSENSDYRIDINNETKNNIYTEYIFKKIKE